MIHHLKEALPHILLVVVANSLNQQLPERFVVKGQFAENIKYLPLQSLSLLLQLFQQTTIHHTLAGFL